MPLDRIAFLTLLAACLVAAPAPAGVRLILPANANLDAPRPKNLIDPDTLPRQNAIEIVPHPVPLPALTPMPAPPSMFRPARLNDQLRAAFPSSAVRLGFVGERLVLTGQAADAGEARAILGLVQVASAGRSVVNQLRVRGQIQLYVLAVEVDRRASVAVGLPTLNGVGDQGRTAAALAALFSARRATVLAAQTIPASEGKTAAFTAARCQVTLCAAGSSEAVSLAVTARFSHSDRSGLAQAIQTVVELRPHETLILTNYASENERDIVLFVTPKRVP